MPDNLVVCLASSIQTMTLTIFQPEKSPASEKEWVTRMPKGRAKFSKGKQRKENLLKYVNKDLVGTQDFYCEGFEREDLTGQISGQ